MNHKIFKSLSFIIAFLIFFIISIFPESSYVPLNKHLIQILYMFVVFGIREIILISIQEESELEEQIIKEEKAELQPREELKTE